MLIKNWVHYIKQYNMYWIIYKAINYSYHFIAGDPVAHSASWKFIFLWTFSLILPSLLYSSFLIFCFLLSFSASSDFFFFLKIPHKKSVALCVYIIVPCSFIAGNYHIHKGKKEYKSHIFACQLPTTHRNWYCSIEWERNIAYMKSRCLCCLPSLAFISFTVWIALIWLSNWSLFFSCVSRITATLRVRAGSSHFPLTFGLKSKGKFFCSFLGIFRGLRWCFLRIAS